jgi:murein DD-endopeptidase MepM/ murein hydrolase activator NlpD
MKFLKTPPAVIAALTLIVIGGGWWFFNTLGEGEKPAIKFAEELKSIGRQKVINLSFGDRKSGLRKISVAISQDNKSQALAAFSFPQKGIKEKTYSLTISPAALKLHDGIALLSVYAVDYSLRKNETLIERPVTIDLTPPQIYLLTPTNNINPGGCCVVAFRISEPTLMAGVQMNNNFSQGYPALFSGKPAFVTYFGIPMVTKKEDATIRVIARDEGGNETSLILPYLIRNKKFRNDKMKLTETFLNQKMLDFQPLPPDVQGKSPLEIFTYVNGPMRIENEYKIIEICRKSESKQLWEGIFLRMKDASPMALFGDKRTYLFGNKNIGESVHFGVDLASLAHAPVEASNNGIVKYAGNMGIYGNTIIIDHGLGIFSIYGHLSVISAKVGQPVRKGEIIGNTGTTGLAGGDHLHFGMVVGGRFVNPIEWWDEHWITDNITNKLAER